MKKELKIYTPPLLIGYIIFTEDTISAGSRDVLPNLTPDIEEEAVDHEIEIDWDLNK